MSAATLYTPRACIERACQIIETADARLLSIDGPINGLPPDMSLSEWRRLYLYLDRARKLMDVK